MDDTTTIHNSSTTLPAGDAEHKIVMDVHNATSGRITQ
jgi:hypothetical protein